jgi:hypothetical protein
MVHGHEAIVRFCRSFRFAKIAKTGSGPRPLAPPLQSSKLAKRTSPSRPGREAISEPLISLHCPVDQARSW